MKQLANPRSSFDLPTLSALTLLVAAGLACDSGGDVTADASPDGDSGVSTTTFRNPGEWQPDGDGVYRLTFAPAAVTIGDQRYCVRAYNGAIPAPTLRIAASQDPRSVRVDLDNAFQSADLQPVGTEVHDFNTTNLHTHGLHVRPDTSSDDAYTADNVLLHLMPGESASFRFDIDEAGVHADGTFWYHPHVHGATAIQVGSGMAGALVVEGPVDALPGIAEAEERIFLLQHIPYDAAQPLADGEECGESNLSINSFAGIAATPAQTLVNGMVEPRIVMPPGQVERWRFIHAGVTQELDLQLRKASAPGDCTAVDGALSMQQIAADGITFSAKQTVDSLFLATGYRADVMIEAPAEQGTYCLVSDVAGAGPGAPVTRHVIAVVEVADSAGAATGAMPADQDLAGVAPPVLDCDAVLDPTYQQDVVFAQRLDEQGNACEGTAPMGPALNINCKQFDPETPRVLVRGRTEEWQVRSEGGPHPFHIHVNPFTVCSIGGQAVTPHWKDTLLIDPAQGTYRLRMEYADFTGQFVQHCHKLHHEDGGMMELIEIVEPAL